MVSKQFQSICPTVVAGVLVALSGCVVGPDYEKPSATDLLGPSFQHDGVWKPAAPADNTPREEWWSVFNDPLLTALMEEAVANNPAPQAALKRVEQARAVRRQAAASKFPLLDGGGSIERERRSGTTNNNGFNGQYSTSVNLPLSFSYEIDVFGRIRRGVEALEAEAEAAEADRQNILLALRGDLAMNYFTMRSLESEIAVLDQAIKLRETTLELLRKRFAAGDVDSLDVSRAETEWTATKARRLGLVRQRELAENAVAVLCGKPPSMLTIEARPVTGPPPRLPEVFPSELLERRPDIAWAERRMAAENARIGLAQAAWYPTINLGASAGFASASLSDLLEWPSRTWSVGPGVSVPLFRGGRIRADVERSKAAYDESVFQYRETILNAIQEVDEAVTSLYWLEQQTAAENETVHAAQNTVDLSTKRYSAGWVAYFEVVDAQRTALDHQQLAAQLEGARYLATVRLIKALGGGWKTDAREPGTETQPESATETPDA